ncbi:hypothetical protein [Treponema sp.]|uniref:hypothetical protein n=1 Tax=Treponema sp. TaxID=166 RepID=UPI00298DB6EE|nr:hypothetical protein [Treponema sp.]MCQ2242416.1 C39 family peptidase [Treponema sp.]
MNNSKDKPYYSQRANALKPNRSCNVTAMISALSSANWPVESFVNSIFKTPADALMNFILTDKQVQDLWHKKDPKGLYPPNEWHEILCYGTNLFLEEKKLITNGKLAVEWGEHRSISDLTRTLDDGGSAALRGLFKYNGKDIGHVVCLVGYERDSYGQIKNWIIDDPFGDYRTGYKNVNGNDIVMSMADFRHMIRPENNELKHAHLVRMFKEC